MTKNKLSTPKAPIFLLISYLVSIFIYVYEMVLYVSSYLDKSKLSTTAQNIMAAFSSMSNDVRGKDLLNEFIVACIFAAMGIAFCVILFMKKRNIPLFVISCIYSSQAFFSYFGTSFLIIYNTVSVVLLGNFGKMQILNLGYMAAQNIAYFISIITSLLVVFFALSTCRSIFRKPFRLKLQAVAKKIVFLPVLLSVLSHLITTVALIVFNCLSMMGAYTVSSALAAVFNFVFIQSLIFLFLLFYGLWIVKHYDVDNFEEAPEAIEKAPEVVEAE